MRLYIPSAKLVPEELQGVGKFPAIIYPVNQKMVFEYLYEQYKDICDNIKITCFENIEKVNRRLSKYKDNVTVEKLNVLKDLGYTVSYAIGTDAGQGIINFGDSIVFDDITNYSIDAFFYAEDTISNKWTFFEEANGKIETIIDKQANMSDTNGKLFVGVFQFSRIDYFQECLKLELEIENSEISSFYRALQRYCEKYPMEAVKTENWFDIGHADTYYNSKIEVKAREFNHITIDKKRGILRKSSDDVDKFLGEIKWYLKLPSDIEYVRPRIFNYSTEYSAPYVSMEYYAYHTVHELFLYGDLTKHQWIDIFNIIKFVCNDFKRYTVKDENILPSLEDMYLNKTMQRFDRLRKDDRFVRFFESPITINGIKYKPMDEIISLLKKEIPKNLYDVNEFSIIHGDLCFANVMVDDKYSFIKVIDPRGKFGTFDLYGDFRYELAKLFHSIDGKYDFIIKDLFAINYDLENAKVDFTITDRARDFDLYDTFLHVFKNEIGEDLKKIEFIEALLFLTMIVLHGESLEHQLAMLGTGLEILNRVIDIQD